MNSSITKNFREGFEKLPEEIKALAVKNYQLWRQDPKHPSLHFKKIGNYWSVWVGMHYRALSREKAGRLFWFWIGHHSVYDRLIRHLE